MFYFILQRLILLQILSRLLSLRLWINSYFLCNERSLRFLIFYWSYFYLFIGIVIILNLSSHRFFLLWCSKFLVKSDCIYRCSIKGIEKFFFFKTSSYHCNIYL